MEDLAAKNRKKLYRQSIFLKAFLFILIFLMAFSPGCMKSLGFYSIKILSSVQQKDHSVSYIISPAVHDKVINKSIYPKNNPGTLNVFNGFWNPFDLNIRESIMNANGVRDDIYLLESIQEWLKSYNDKIQEQLKSQNHKEEPAKTEGSSNASKNNDKEAKTEAASNNTGSIELELLHLINSARLNSGMGVLNFNATLNSVAAGRSQDMISRGYFSHQTPDGKTIFTILQEKGIGYSRAGENIYYASPPSLASAGSAFSTWFNSSAHRENILSGNFSQIGIGIASNSSRLVITIVLTG